MRDVALASQLVAVAALVKHVGYSAIESYKLLGLERAELTEWAKRYYDKTPAELIAEINQGKRRTANRIGEQHTLLKLSNRSKRLLSRYAFDDHNICSDEIPVIEGDVFLAVSPGYTKAHIEGDANAAVVTNNVTVVTAIIDGILENAAKQNGKRK